MPINNINENNAARERLIAQLRTGRLIGCTGAGLSVWAGYRSWRDVITRLAAEVDRRRLGEVNTRLVLQNHGGDLLLCAQILGSELGEPAFSEFVRTEFGATGLPIHDVLLRIASLPLRHILTLNFDVSYESAHLEIRASCQTITSCNRLDLARFLRDMYEPDYPKQAVHLHGKYDDTVQQIALTEVGYALFYRDTFFKNFVWSMATKRLFFLGFGFTDTDFTNILRDSTRDVRGNGLNHFGLVGLGPDQSDNERRTFLNERYILDPVFYNVVIGEHGEENHDEFAGIVNAISVALGMPEQAASPGLPVIAPAPVMPVDPQDELRAEELNRRLLDRVEPGGDGVYRSTL